MFVWKFGEFKKKEIPRAGENNKNSRLQLKSTNSIRGTIRIQGLYPRERATSGQRGGRGRGIMASYVPFVPRKMGLGINLSPVLAKIKGARTRRVGGCGVHR
ncbi:Uncharacterized protein HZ326_23706 [Fusarium oxysporum f. sp. albedinis]|nr:Uncharacterized protein HZ326_23706 [Fusarium oxysporum f. sp. albedinis]